MPESAVLDALNEAVRQASHLGPLDAPAVEAARALARKIDAWDVIVEWATDDVGDREGARPAVPANDNVSLPTFLKFCDALGLTPAGRSRAAIEEKPGGASGAKVGKFRAVAGGKSA